MSCALAVIAKAPVPGRVKTRLCPPCTPQDAAVLARAALLDTLDAVRATPAPRRVLVLEGVLSGADTEGFDVIAQRGDGLAGRLAAAFADIAEPCFLVGMDTPQVTATLLAAGQAALDQREAVLARATDGGYWGIGLRRPDAGVFAGVPMSEPATADAQRAALDALGLAPAELPWLRDVDTFADALAVAGAVPNGRFAAAVGGLQVAA